MQKKKLIDPETPTIQTKQRMFQGLPVREGRGDILVQPTRADIASALRHDPENCAYAICLKRMLNTTRVYVYTTVAYVQTMDEGGTPILERYMVKNHAHAWVQKFDRGEDVGPGGFILHKPTGTKTLESKRKESRAWARAHPARVREAAHQQWLRIKAKQKGPTLQQEFTFRDGTGQVKFIGTYNGKLAIHKTT